MHKQDDASDGVPSPTGSSKPWYIVTLHNIESTAYAWWFGDAPAALAEMRDIVRRKPGACGYVSRVIASCEWRVVETNAETAASGNASTNVDAIASTPTPRSSIAAWGDFLSARAHVIDYMISQGDSAEAIARSLSMDDEQVRRIAARDRSNEI